MVVTTGKVGNEMNRRGFMKLLAATPLIGLVKPEPKPEWPWWKNTSTNTDPGLATPELDINVLNEEMQRLKEEHTPPEVYVINHSDWMRVAWTGKSVHVNHIEVTEIFKKVS